jgi:hypothetical protein
VELDFVVDVVAMEAQHHPRLISIPASAQPPGAAPVVWQVPAATRWRVRSTFARLTTSAFVATRTVVLTWFDQTGNILGVTCCTQHQAASLTEVYTFAYGANTNSGGINQIFSQAIPLIELAEGWSIQLSVSSADVGDLIDEAIIVVDVVPSRTLPPISDALRQLA